jgi:low affinity Fe/Cu permease
MTPFGKPPLWGYMPRDTPTTKERNSVSEGSGVAQAREHSSRSIFDRFAGRSSEFVSRAPFFGFCVLLVVVWAPTYFLVGNPDTYQLIINTPTTIITFLLVAVLQNTQKRNEEALQHKLDALADGLADPMEHFAEDEPERRSSKQANGTLSTSLSRRNPTGDKSR